MKFTDQDKRLLSNFIEDSKTNGISGISELEDLWDFADTETEELIKKIIALDPTAYGFKGKKLKLEPVPDNIIPMKSESLNKSGEYQLDSNTYLPEDINLSYESMAYVFKRHYPNRQLLIGSGYRSPAFQIVTLVYILVRVYDFNLKETLKRVALPNYSQHCSVTNTAVDFLNIDGQPTDEDPIAFSRSVEYDWLKKHAHKFNFYESYPPDNKDGIMWEPWHWQYIEKT
jgi:D-alanyl-D-alanine carboxypeptidase